MDTIQFSFKYNKKNKLNKDGKALVQLVAYKKRSKEKTKYKYISTSVYLRPDQGDQANNRVINILKHAPSEYFIIMEDDLGSDYRGIQLKNKIQETINATPADFDIIYFEYCHESCSFITSPSERLKNPLCLGATLWKKESALKFIDSLYLESKHIDDWILDRIKKGLIKSYGPYPPIFFQKSNLGSDLPIYNSYFLRRLIFDEKDRHCVQNEIKHVGKITLGLISVSFIAYKVFKSYRATKGG